MRAFWLIAVPVVSWSALASHGRAPDEKPKVGEPPAVKKVPAELDALMKSPIPVGGLTLSLTAVPFAGVASVASVGIAGSFFIGGRAGRYRTDGTFGVTGDCPEMDPDLVAAVEGHAFDPVPAAEWRNSRLDFSSLRELGVSILLVEQNARAALETADFGYVLETGEIVHSGAAADLMHDPRVTASYLGGR